MKLSNKAINVGVGEGCPKCKVEMNRRKHPEYFKSKKSYYYEQWDFCEKCKHVQHYEEFKSKDWRENEDKESFINSLR